MDSMIPTGAQAPGFQLVDTHGQVWWLQEMRGKIVVLNFWSAECTWCKRVDHEINAYLEAWNSLVEMVWIASNTNEPLELLEKVAAERGIPRVLIDPQQQVADLYGAQTTPHFFVIDKTGKLAYQGAWDDITFRQRTATQVYVPLVVEALKNQRTPAVTQTPPYGCVLVRC
jgi:peroxiredoxin